jgi:hypothetical protein
VGGVDGVGEFSSLVRALGVDARFERAGSADEEERERPEG